MRTRALSLNPFARGVSIRRDSNLRLRQCCAQLRPRHTGNATALITAQRGLHSDTPLIYHCMFGAANPRP